LIGAEIGREEINRVEGKIEKKVFYIKSLQVDVELIAESETDPEIKKELFQLAEKIRFSDPMSNEILAEIEKEISDRIKELKLAENKKPVIATINALLMERNKKTKILK
jgi:hypothetical protein